LSTLAKYGLVPASHRHCNEKLMAFAIPLKHTRPAPGDDRYLPRRSFRDSVAPFTPDASLRRRYRTKTGNKLP